MRESNLKLIFVLNRNMQRNFIFWARVCVKKLNLKPMLLCYDSFFNVITIIYYNMKNSNATKFPHTSRFSPLLGCSINKNMILKHVLNITVVCWVPNGVWNKFKCYSYNHY
jgi:hypothetical protein